MDFYVKKGSKGRGNVDYKVRDSDSRCWGLSFYIATRTYESPFRGLFCFPGALGPLGCTPP